MYNKISDRSTVFNKEFFDIYNKKCAYCGISLDILSHEYFEVDHFIAESTFEDKFEAGKLENLVLACQKCNRNKKEFVIHDEYCTYLNPDNCEIAKVFYRDKAYNICIKDEYKNDEYIKQFYEKIEFDSQFRRLDYLLLNISALKKKIKNEDVKYKLAEALTLLQEKKNKTWK